MEGFADAAALFAVAGHRDAAHLAYLGLHALQHRGRGGVALAAADGALVRYRSGSGLVRDAVDARVLASLPGMLAAGHAWGRLDPGDPPEARDALEVERMIHARYRGGQAAAAVSGRFTNGGRLRRELKEAGALLHTPSDGELLLHLVAHSAQKTFVNRLVDALWKVEGAYALVVACEDRVIAVRDPAGFRPLVLGRLGDAVLVASEDTAIRFVGGEVRRDVRPGEMVILDGRNLQSVTPFARREPAACVHESVALARADAAAFGLPVHEFRERVGERLAREHPCLEAEVVTGLPGAGDALANAYARTARVPFQPALLKEPYTTGPVEEPAGSRDFGTRLAIRAIPSVVSGRAVVLVVPSVVTGRGTRRIVRLVLDAGARAVHVRVGSPPVRSACPYGVSSPTTDELLATTRAGDPAEWLGARSLAYLSLEALRELAGPGRCDACFSAERPLVPEEDDDQLPLF